ncbi:hypothetical protein MTR_3g065800 [Medicago truncatula]|uniref:F-box domain-containing protein n=1 Tax=Medicago truncatula TaxID=3880 RepID=A0A072UXR3_MEDTR|nr:hypothetical protein MTR_3g065800 [Medicago truncatula]
MSSSSISTKEVEGDSPNWLELPTEITRNILQRIHIVERITRKATDSNKAAAKEKSEESKDKGLQVPISITKQ